MKSSTQWAGPGDAQGLDLHLRLCSTVQMSAHSDGQVRHGAEIQEGTSERAGPAG